MKKRQEKIDWLIEEQSAPRQSIAPRLPETTAAGILFPEEAEEFMPLCLESLLFFYEEEVFSGGAALGEEEEDEEDM